MPPLYPPVEPYESGVLDVGDGNAIAWEVCGNPSGRAAVVLHGGPGSGCHPGMRRFFDPDAYRVVLFDQRGCGRIRPHASEPAADLTANTTDHLLGDIERLRAHLDIDRWLVFGVSWGCTLGLAYALRQRDQVTAFVASGVTTTRRSEIDWLYRDVAPLFPVEWARFTSGGGVAPDDRSADLVEAYHGLLHDRDPAVRAKAAEEWTAWDLATASVGAPGPLSGRWADPAFQLARSRLCTHYFRHRAWLDDGMLLREAPILAGIPAVLINGRLDLGSPIATAWALAQRWPAAELVVVDGAGHSTGDAGMAEAIVAATNRLAGSA